jgi:alcohol dehydrogenase class IV
MNNMYVCRQPELKIGQGLIGEVPAILQQRGCRGVAVVTGGRSVRAREAWSRLTEDLLDMDIPFLDFTARGEPTPEMVDHFYREVVRDLGTCDTVVAIGGGSVIDAAKALAAALGMSSPGSEDVSIGDYLEGVGTRKPDGRTLPLIAMPTTAGTGSEATKNAVLRALGPNGFKKSLRHDNYVPVAALIDPDLQVGMPLEVTRSSGLDAITQLMEVYVSTAANAVTDALALDGLRRAGRAFPRILGGDDSVDLRTDMALGAYYSGVGLASVGLGVVHGIASPLGARRDIPHGVACGLTLAPSVRITAESEGEGSDRGRRRYADIAEAMGLGDVPALIDTLEGWAAPLPRLGSYGFSAEELPEVARESGLKNHPVELTREEILAIMEAVL